MPWPGSCLPQAGGRRAARRVPRERVVAAAYGTTMATLDDAGRMAAGLPEVTEGERHGNRTWFVMSKAFAWERPFSKADIRRFADETPPDGPILAVRVADLGEKEAVLAVPPRTAAADQRRRLTGGGGRRHQAEEVQKDGGLRQVPASEASAW